MTERSVAIIGKGMIGISMAVLFTGNGIPTIMLAKNADCLLYTSPSPRD